MARRIQVMGSSGSGKSTVGLRLAAVLDLPHVELDALFFLPGWVQRTDEDFRDRIRRATEGDRWVVSGNQTRRVLDVVWPRAETIVWLDLPLRVTIPRVFLRSWRRWRTQELLWGTNVERFWPQLALWDPERSVVGYSIRSRHRFVTLMTAAMSDPRWAHISFIRLTSQREVDRFLGSVEAAADRPAAAEGEHAP
ncbi:MAG: hypothetical protein WC273_01325 [Dehalococcoidia bacterium]